MADRAGGRRRIKVGINQKRDKPVCDGKETGPVSFPFAGRCHLARAFGVYNFKVGEVQIGSPNSHNRDVLQFLNDKTLNKTS